MWKHICFTLAVLLFVSTACAPIQPQPSAAATPLPTAISTPSPLPSIEPPVPTLTITATINSTPTKDITATITATATTTLTEQERYKQQLEAVKQEVQEKVFDRLYKFERPTGENVTTIRYMGSHTWDINGELKTDDDFMNTKVTSPGQVYVFCGTKVNRVNDLRKGKLFQGVRVTRNPRGECGFARPTETAIKQMIPQGNPNATKEEIQEQYKVSKRMTEALVGIMPDGAEIWVDAFWDGSVYYPNGIPTFFITENPEIMEATNWEEIPIPTLPEPPAKTTTIK